MFDWSNITYSSIWYEIIIYAIIICFVDNEIRWTIPSFIISHILEIINLLFSSIRFIFFEFFLNFLYYTFYKTKSYD